MGRESAREDVRGLRGGETLAKPDPAAGVKPSRGEFSRPEMISGDTQRSRQHARPTRTTRLLSTCAIPPTGEPGGAVSCLDQLNAGRLELMNLPRELLSSAQPTPFLKPSTCPAL